MRVSLLAVGLLVFKASAAGAPAADLRGTARAGGRPQPSTALDFALTYSLRHDIDAHRP